ncbi:MAG TPA: hypothetical protein PKO36_17915 [Candidatus Hydrogenedentes bacterium]|nr:hypothetical protein [Candidatus Hydrogenedentota bacterium]HOT49876.1 hypothetical protein [Candidatus Hydrogenedentota bacterium]HOV75910.1 hypothetical protein [Candidatus Hydrogenedentota bacterium]HPC17908.1 hypothetical protein [Candidatus Hydrogenedentota bacterium]HRT19181.1 hypothetical protein [Candidatus Hydrogenedentota bacterium]
MTKFLFKTTFKCCLSTGFLPVSIGPERAWIFLGAEGRKNCSACLFRSHAIFADRLVIVLVIVIVIAL